MVISMPQCLWFNMKSHTQFLPIFVAIIKSLVTYNNLIYSKEVDKSGTEPITYVQGSQKPHPSNSLWILWGEIEPQKPLPIVGTVSIVLCTAAIQELYAKT